MEFLASILNFNSPAAARRKQQNFRDSILVAIFLILIFLLAGIPDLADIFVLNRTLPRYDNRGTGLQNMSPQNYAVCPYSGKGGTTLKAIEMAKTELEQHFKLKVTPVVDEYIGCSMIHGDRYIDIWQPDLIKDLIKKFSHRIVDLKKFDTPIAPNERVVRPTDDTQIVTEDMKAEYRSGVGMLLYLVKHSRPTLANSTRELAKVMDGPTLNHMKMMDHAIKYVRDTHYHVFRLKPIKTTDNRLVIHAYCNSDFAGDKDNRRSFTGYAIFLNGGLVSYKSKRQDGVLLSLTEAGCYALSKVAKELLFIHQVLEFLGFEVILLIIIWVDNVGAIYLTKNMFIGQRTKNIDTCHHFFNRFLLGVLKNTVAIAHYVDSETRSPWTYVELSFDRA